MNCRFCQNNLTIEFIDLVNSPPSNSFLNKEELKNYIYHRLKVAGASDKLKFTDKAIDAIYEHSQGTPRIVNVICDRALLAGFVKETFTIDEIIINKCVEEVGYQKA